MVGIDPSLYSTVVVVNSVNIKTASTGDFQFCSNCSTTAYTRVYAYARYARAQCECGISDTQILAIIFWFLIKWSIGMIHAKNYKYM